MVVVVLADVEEDDDDDEDREDDDGDRLIETENAGDSVVNIVEVEVDTLLTRSELSEDEFAASFIKLFPVVLLEFMESEEGKLS